MEIQLNELIEQIKREGVAEAENSAKTILDNANSEAEKIINDAKQKALKIVSDAENEKARIVKISEEAICQAGRNVLISFRESVKAELQAVMTEGVNKTFSSSRLEDIISDVVVEYSKQGNDNITVLLNKSDLEALEKALYEKLRERISDGVTLKASDDFSKGFRVLLENESVYYDYSSSSVVEMISEYLNPKVAALMKEAETK